MHIVGTYTLSVSAGSIQSLYKEYVNVPCVLYTVGVFVFLKDVAGWLENISWFKKTIEMMGKYTFPVYLLHWFFLKIITGLNIIDTKSIFYRLLMPYGVYLAIMLITWCLRRILVVRKLVP